MNDGGESTHGISTVPTVANEVANGPRRNLLANYVNFVVLGLLGIIANPLLANGLGPSAFGLWKTCQRFLDFASVADGRSTQALKWVVANRSITASDTQKSRDLGAAAVVWLLWLPVLLVVSTVMVLLLPHIARNLGSEMIVVARWTGAILACNILLSGLLMIPDAVLVGTNQGYRSMHITTIALVLGNLAMVMIVVSGGSIVELGMVILIAGVLNGLTTWWIAKKHIRWWRFGRPRSSDVAELAGFSGWVLLWSLIEKILLSSDIVLISFLAGTVAVADYTFTSYVAQFILSACLLTTSAYMPRLGSLVGSRDSSAAARLIEQTREVNLALVTVTGSAVLILNRPFVTLWAGQSRYMGDVVNLLMVIGLFQLVLIRNDAQIHDTALNIRSRVLLGLLSAVAGPGLAWLLYNLTSSVAAILAGLVCSRLLLSVAYPVLVKRQISGVRLNLARTLGAITLIGLCYEVGIGVDTSRLIVLLTLAVATFLAVPVAFLSLVSRRTRRQILDALRSRYARERQG